MIKQTTSRPLKRIFVFTESVKTFYEWLEIKDKEQSIAYCTVNCSAQVLSLLLQPCN